MPPGAMPAFTPLPGKGKVFLDAEPFAGTGHRVLEYTGTMPALPQALSLVTSFIV